MTIIKGEAMREFSLVEALAGDFAMAADEYLYLVKCDGEVVYVGQTAQHVARRLRQHQQSIGGLGAALREWPGRGATLTVALTTPAEVARLTDSPPSSLTVNDAERILIQMHRPCFNTVYNRGG